MADIILLSSVIESTVEHWRAIKDFPGYEVSNLGRVRSFISRDRKGLKRHERNRIGVIPQLVRLALHKQGYLQAYIYRDRKKVTRFAHILVAQAFLPNPDALPEVNHISAVKSDNRVANLEWKSRSGNQRHAWDNGLVTADMIKQGLFQSIRKGTNRVVRLSEDQVLEIRRLHSEGASQSSIGRLFGIGSGHVCNIVNRKMWTFI